MLMKLGTWSCLEIGIQVEHIIKILTMALERLEEVKCLATNLTGQNSVQEEIKNRFKSRNACSHSMQNIFSSSLLSKNIKIKIHSVIRLSVVLYGCETWSLTLTE